VFRTWTGKNQPSLGLQETVDSQAGRARGTDKPGKHAVTVCLVDDDPSVLKATGRLLSFGGWKVESFLDPIEFLRYARTHRPEVVVIDIWMPVMDGLDMQRRLRVLCPSTRVIVLTSNDDPVVRSKAMATGAWAFFLKTVGPEEFLAGIESAASS
jgi:FixJ family two-component response regulator